MNALIAAQRLDNQRITRPWSRPPADLVAWLGAVQAQEYRAAKWALGLRMTDGVTDADLERAFDEGKMFSSGFLQTPVSVIVS